MAGEMTADIVQVNGWQALLLRMHGHIDAMMTSRVQDGLVSLIYTVRNPEKLSQITQITQKSVGPDFAK